MVGETLYPLNQLERIDAPAAISARTKYASRENLMAVRIPILDCLWNDVLHLSPVHPSKIRKALNETGHLREAGSLRFYAIAPAALQPGKAVFFRHSKDVSPQYDFLESDFVPFDPLRYREMSDIPKAQRQEYIKKRGEGQIPLFWSRTPHVFYRGPICVRGLEIIGW